MQKSHIIAHLTFAELHALSITALHCPRYTSFCRMTQHTNQTEPLLIAGVVPEHIVKQLCNNRVNYYFAQINRSTEQMTDMFAGEYKHSQNAVFKVLEYTANAATFIPMIVESIRDSMKRSSYFGSGRSVGSASHRTNKGDHLTVFHSVL